MALPDDWHDDTGSVNRIIQETPENKGFLQVWLDARRKWQSEVIEGVSDFSGPIFLQTQVTP